VTLITLQEGKLVLRDGAIGTEQACCCGECPECPFSSGLEGQDFSTCRLRIYLDFGDFVIEEQNDIIDPSLFVTPPPACAYEVISLDWPEESCGDFSGLVVYGYDQDCQCPVIKQLIGFSPEEQFARQLARWIEDGEDPDEFPGCDGLPFRAEIVDCPEPCGNPLP
jgi:hypothetical protein